MKWVFISRMASRLKAEASFIFVFSGVLIFVCLNPRQEETRSFPQTKDDKYYGQIVGQTVGSRGYVTITVK
ncbi:hypothetical protein AVP43_02792 [Geobacillus stearothermophilus]|uniref:hypothetical protein n=1 Tax=Geobacillus sp. DSP4a TaxID=2508873 RepID=UPI0007B23FCD|nr:hypothetical protein [Geobacillus sp. DSP4a]KZE93744.1 hypothetical protein AVP43_02792 [Geobacillus stearothermophilus]NNV00323.1 hypothetical protein [Geobacillus sp. DSP4a]